MMYYMNIQHLKYFIKARSIWPQEGNMLQQWANPPHSFFDIKYWQSYKTILILAKNCCWSNYKVFSLYCCNNVLDAKLNIIFHNIDCLQLNVAYSGQWSFCLNTHNTIICPLQLGILLSEIRKSYHGDFFKFPILCALQKQNKYTM